MGQRIILYKRLPSPSFIDGLIANGVLRAGMTFLPGSPYVGAGIFPETQAYGVPLTSGGGGSTVTSLTTSTTATEPCPYPDDTLACLIWEIEQLLHKLSYGVPQAFNAFVFLTVAAGSRHEWALAAERLVTELAGSGDYFANGHLVGHGPYNAVFEFLTDDHQRLQRVIRVLTDHEYVEDVMVGHLAAADARGFGGEGTESVG